MTMEFSLKPLSEASPRSKQPDLGSMGYRALVIQAGVLLLSVLALLAIDQSLVPSFLVGGMGSILPQLLVTLLLGRTKSDGSQPLQFLKLLYLSEFGKIITTILILAISLASRMFQPAALLAGFLVLMAAAWIGLLIAAFGRTRNGS